MGYNKNDYKWGNEYAISAWASKRWISLFSSSIRMEYVYTTPIKGRDPSLYSFMEPAANTQNYGGQRVLGHIGTFVYFLHTQKLGLEFGLPLFQDLNGYQTPLQYQIQALYSIGF
jgi:hypothetical protein